MFSAWATAVLCWLNHFFTYFAVLPSTSSKPPSELVLNPGTSDDELCHSVGAGNRIAFVYQNHADKRPGPTTFRSTPVLCSRFWYFGRLFYSPHLGTPSFRRLRKKQHKEQCALVLYQPATSTAHQSEFPFSSLSLHKAHNFADFFVVLINSAPCTKMLSV